MFKSLMEIIFGKQTEYTTEDDAMAQPDIQEATDLGLHVRQCARRYGALMRNLVSVENRLNTTNKLILAIIVILFASDLIDLKQLLSGIVAWVN